MKLFSNYIALLPNLIPNFFALPVKDSTAPAVNKINSNLFAKDGISFHQLPPDLHLARYSEFNSIPEPSNIEVNPNYLWYSNYMDSYSGLNDEYVDPSDNPACHVYWWYWRSPPGCYSALIEDDFEAYSNLASPYSTWSRSPRWEKYSALNQYEAEFTNNASSPYYIWSRQPRWGRYSNSNYEESQDYDESEQCSNIQHNDEGYHTDEGIKSFDGEQANKYHEQNQATRYGPYLSGDQHKNLSGKGRNTH